MATTVVIFAIALSTVDVVCRYVSQDIGSAIHDSGGHVTARGFLGFLSFDLSGDKRTNARRKIVNAHDYRRAAKSKEVSTCCIVVYEQYNVTQISATFAIS